MQRAVTNLVPWRSDTVVWKPTFQRLWITGGARALLAYHLTQGLTKNGPYQGGPPQWAEGVQGAAPFTRILLSNRHAKRSLPRYDPGTDPEASSHVHDDRLETAADFPLFVATDH
jgi:hypothetical protein